MHSNTCHSLTPTTLFFARRTHFKLLQLLCIIFTRKLQPTRVKEFKPALILDLRGVKVGEINWQEVVDFYTINPISHTKTGEEFHVTRVTNTAIYIDLPSGEEYIGRNNLEIAAHLINQGVEIRGPKDYREKVYDQRPAYAWAILRDLGLV